MVQNLPTIQETRVQFLSWENLLEKGMATHSSIPAWRIPWTEEPGGLQSKVSQRVRHDWATNTHTHTYTHPARFRVWSSNVEAQENKHFRALISDSDTAFASDEVCTHKCVAWMRTTLCPREVGFRAGVNHKPWVKWSRGQEEDFQEVGVPSEW